MAGRVVHRLLDALACPRRIAAVVMLLVVAWSLQALGDARVLPGVWASSTTWLAAASAALTALAALGLWRGRRWAWWVALLVQGAPLLAALVLRVPGWHLLPHAIVLVLLLLPPGRRTRALWREPGFEPGDTVPASQPRR
jgi:hypothetical protein